MAFYFRIDHQHRLLAVFSPKCASNSIHKWMNELAQTSGQGSGFNRLHADRISPRQLLDYKDYTCVLFLRDPLRRLVSFYSKWVVMDPGIWNFADNDQRFQIHQKSFREFLYIMDHLSRHGLRFQHHLEMQVGNLPEFKFHQVVLTERLNQGFQTLADLLGCSLKPDHNKRHNNRTSTNDQLQEFVADYKPSQLVRTGIPEYKWFYDDETMDLARRIYSPDIAYYQAHGGQILEGVGPVQAN